MRGAEKGNSRIWQKRKLARESDCSKVYYGEKKRFNNLKVLNM